MWFSCKFSPKPIHWLSDHLIGDTTDWMCPTWIPGVKHLLLVRAKRRVAGWVAGGCWGLLGWLLIVRQWIIPENSLRLAPVSLSLTWFTCSMSFFECPHVLHQSSFLASMFPDFWLTCTRCVAWHPPFSCCQISNKSLIFVVSPIFLGKQSAFSNHCLPYRFAIFLIISSWFHSGETIMVSSPSSHVFPS